MGDLLSAMKLERYIPKFQQEVITGGVLLELTDDILREELGVQNRIHLLKLTKVISGERSAEEIINGEGPYMKMTKI